jgi:hypothetical protein
LREARHLEWRELRVGTPETATLSSQTMATITAAARSMYPQDALPDDVYARVGSVTPFSRVHSANFTALSRLVAFLLPPLLPLPVSAGVFEQPTLIRATMTRAASGCSVLLMFSPRVW